MMKFKSMAAFIAHLKRVEASLEGEFLKAMTKGATVIRIRAWHKIGEYQEQSGEFQAWRHLTQETILQRVREGYEPNDPLLRSGDLRASIAQSTSGTYTRRIASYKSVVGSPLMVAVWMERGTHNKNGIQVNPPRSFLGASAFEKAPVVVDAIAGGIVSALCGIPIVL
jgi:hypothetical protein